MRIVAALIVLVAALLVTDSIALNGRYRTALWEAAKYQGENMRSQVNYQFRRLGL
jgi:hypothetical protein